MAWEHPELQWQYHLFFYKGEHAKPAKKQRCDQWDEKKTISKMQNTLGYHIIYSTLMLMAPSLVIVKNWKEPRWPLIGKWTNYNIAQQYNVYQQWPKQNRNYGYINMGKSNKSHKIMLSDGVRQR